jgi:hypothetical protein
MTRDHFFARFDLKNAAIDSSNGLSVLTHCFAANYLALHIATARPTASMPLW